MRRDVLSLVLRHLLFAEEVSAWREVWYELPTDFCLFSGAYSHKLRYNTNIVDVSPVRAAQSTQSHK